MSWFKARLKVKDHIPQKLKRITANARGNKGTTAFFSTLVRGDDGVHAFFKAMFEQRGSGGSFNGRPWLPLSERWLAFKRRQGYDSRIGFRTSALFDSLVNPGAPNQVFQVGTSRVTFGTKVPYASRFNAARPVIDAQTIKDLRVWLLHSQTFLNATTVLRDKLFDGVRP